MQPADGTGQVTVNPDNTTVHFVAGENWYGVITFIYQICDGSEPPLCDTAPAQVTINATAPVASSFEYTILETGSQNPTPITIDVFANATVGTAPLGAMTLFSQPNLAKSTSISGAHHLHPKEGLVWN
jgi:hypothetical protein